MADTTVLFTIVSIMRIKTAKTETRKFFKTKKERMF